ncbi:hypothetical protein H9P43_000794 [Blastocladiella emersonii ATCC 22665]|nr:hypothetical protein H9P43_000794 [Blastocladiella emersonii ATCC 22665]
MALDGGFLAAHPFTNVAAVGLGAPLTTWLDKKKHKQFAHLGDTLLWSPGHKTPRALNQLVATFPDLNFATQSFSSPNGRHFVSLVPGPCLVHVDLEAMYRVMTVDPASLRASTAAGATPDWGCQVGLPPLFSHRVKSVFVSDDGGSVAIVSEFNAVFTLDVRATIAGLRKSAVSGSGSAPPTPSKRRGTDEKPPPPTGVWTQLACPVVATQPAVTVHVAWSGDQVLVRYIGCLAQSQGADGDGRVPVAVHLVAVTAQRHKSSVLHCLQHRFLVDTPDSWSPGGFLRAAPVRESRILGDMAVELAVHAPTGRIALLIHGSTSRGATAGSGPADPQSPSTAAWGPRMQGQRILLLDGVGTASPSAIVLTPTRFFDSNAATTGQSSASLDAAPASAFGANSSVATGMLDPVVSMTWLAQPDLPLLALLSRSGRLVWVTPSGRVSQAPEIVDDLNARFMRGGDISQSKLTLRRPSASRAAGTASAKPLQTIPTALPSRAPKTPSAAWTRHCLVSAAVEVPTSGRQTDGAKSPRQVEYWVLATDGQGVVALRPPFATAALPDLLSAEQLRVPFFAHARGTLVPLHLTAIRRLRVWTDAVDLGQQPWVLDPLSTEEEDAVVTGPIPLQSLDVAPEVQDARFLATLDRVLAAALDAAQETQMLQLDSSGHATSVNGSSGSRRPSARSGFLRSGTSGTGNLASLSTVAVSTLLQCLDQLWLPCRGPRLLLGVSIAARLMERLLIQTAWTGVDYAALHVAQHTRRWLAAQLQHDDASGSGAMFAWSMGWRHLEEQLYVTAASATPSQGRTVLLECVRMLAMAESRNCLPDADAFDAMRADGVTEVAITFIEEGHFALLTDEGSPQTAFDVKMRFLYSLMNGDWATAHRQFQLTLAPGAWEALGGDDEAADTVNCVRMGWIRLVVQVVQALQREGGGVPVAITVPSPFDPDRWIPANTPSLLAFARERADLFDPSAALAAAMQARDALLLNKVLATVADAGAMAAWASTWPNVLVCALSAAQHAGQSNENDDDVALQTATVVDDLLSWLLAGGDVDAARFVVQMTMADTTGDLAALLGAVHGHFFERVMDHIARVVRAELPPSASFGAGASKAKETAASAIANAPPAAPPRRGSKSSRRTASSSAGTAATSADWGPVLHTYPTVAYLLQQTIFENEHERWPADVAYALVPLIDWLRCAVQLAAAARSSVPGGGLFRVLRVLYAIELRNQVVAPLRLHGGDAAGLAPTSVTWVEHVLLLAHFDDVFGEAAVVRLAATALRAVLSGRRGRRRRRPSDDEDDDERDDVSRESVLAVLDGLGALLNPRVTSMIVAETVTAPLDGVAWTGGLAPTMASAAHSWMAWNPSGFDDPQSPQTPDGPVPAPAGVDRVAALLDDPRFRVFCDEVLPVLHDHVLAVPAAAGDPTTSVFERARAYWQPRFPSLLPAKVMDWGPPETFGGDEEQQQVVTAEIEVEAPSQDDCGASASWCSSFPVREPFNVPYPPVDAETGSASASLAAEGEPFEDDEDDEDPFPPAPRPRSARAGGSRSLMSSSHRSISSRTQSSAATSVRGSTRSLAAASDEGDVLEEVDPDQLHRSASFNAPDDDGDGEGSILESIRDESAHTSSRHSSLRSLSGRSVQRNGSSGSLQRTVSFASDAGHGDDELESPPVPPAAPSQSQAMVETLVDAMARLSSDLRQLVVVQAAPPPPPLPAPADQAPALAPGVSVGEITAEVHDAEEKKRSSRKKRRKHVRKDDDGDRPAKLKHSPSFEDFVKDRRA